MSDNGQERVLEPGRSAPAPREVTAESILALRRRVPVESHDLPDGRRVWIYGLTDHEVQQWYADCSNTGLLATSSDNSGKPIASGPLNGGTGWTLADGQYFEFSLEILLTG
jgi:hypothetical protein